MNAGDDGGHFDDPNASSESSEEEQEAEEQDEEWEELETMPNGRKDIKHAVAKLVVDMRSSSAMTRVGVRRAMNGAELVLKVNNMSLKEDVRAYLTREGVEVANNPQAQDLLRKFDVYNHFEGAKSDQGQVSIVSKYFSFIKPESVFIGNRLDQRLQDGDVYRQVPVPNTYQYVSVIKILQLIASKPTVMEYVRNCRPSDDGMLYGFIDSDQYRNSPFFQAHPDAFQCILYYDGIDAARGLGPKSGLHEVGNFLLIVINVPPILNSTLAGLHPIVLANTQDCRGTFVDVLNRFVEEMQQLERGVRVFVNGEFIEIFATLVGVKGDSKAVHELLGFLGCGARHFCRLCMISRPELHSGEVILGQRRTPEMMEEHLARVARNEAFSTQCGLRYRTCLHDLQHFHAANNCNFDLMHDCAEGVILMLIRLCMKQFIIVEQLFDVEELNHRIAAFQYVEEVDGEAFLGLSEEELLTDFSILTHDQRKKIICIVNRIKNQGTEHDNAQDVCLNLASAFCVGQDGVILKATDLPLAKQETVWNELPCISRSFFRSAKEPFDSFRNRCSLKPQTDPNTVEPLDVLDILNMSQSGREVVEFVQQNKFLSYSHQVKMIHLVYDHVVSDSSTKVAPSPNSIAIAKGIVLAFPELADEGDCPWQSWYHYALMKFETASLETFESRCTISPRPETTASCTSEKQSKNPSAISSPSESQTETSLFGNSSGHAKRDSRSTVSFSKQHPVLSSSESNKGKGKRGAAVVSSPLKPNVSTRNKRAKAISNKSLKE